MGIDTIPVPPIRDLSKPQQVGRLVDYLHATAGALQRLADETAVPTAPTLITVRQGAGNIVEIDATFSEPETWTTTEFYRNTVNNSATAVLIESKRAHVTHDVNVSYGTTYYYWAKVVASAATSAFSPVGSITVALVQTVDVALNAVSQHVQTTGSTPVTENSQVETTLMTRGITTVGGDVLVFWWGDIELVNESGVTSDVLGLIRLYRDTTILRTSNLSFPDVATTQNVKVPGIFAELDLALAASSYTYKITFQANNAATAVTIRERSLAVKEAKR